MLICSIAFGHGLQIHAKCYLVLVVYMNTIGCFLCRGRKLLGVVV